MPRRILLSILTLTLLTVGTARAAVPMNRGSVQLSQNLNGVYGISTYTVQYDFPSSVQTGSNLTFQLTLVVDNLTQVQSYITLYSLVVTVYALNPQPLTGQVGEDTGLKPLYPGGHWGPYNVTIPVTSANTGAAPGAPVNASVSLALQTKVSLGGQYVGSTVPENPQAALGYVIINEGGSSTGGSGNYVPYLLVGVGVVVLAVSALVFGRKTRGPS
jgi:hypothetical protein